MKISKRNRNRAMKIYSEYFKQSRHPDSVTPTHLYEHGFPRNVDALETTRLLASMGYLSLTHFKLERDSVLDLTDAGRCYFEVRSDDTRRRWLDRLYGFVSGVVLTVVADLIVRFVAG